MSRENVEVVRRGYEALNRGDYDGMVADIAPEFEYITAGLIPGTDAIYRGPDGWKRFASWLTDEFDDARVEPREFLERGDKVVTSVTLSGRGKQSGAGVRWDVWLVWTLRDGKVVQGRGFTSRQQSLEAAGLSE